MDLDGFPAAPTRMRPDGGVFFAATFDHEDVITAGEEGVSRWRAGQRVEKLLSWFAGTLSWIDDHTLMADGSVIRMDTGGSHLLAHHAIQISAAIDRTHVITGGWDRTVRVWDLEREARPIITLDAEAASDELVVGAGGRRAVSRSIAVSRIELWDVVPSPVQTLDVQGHVEKMLAFQDRLAVQVLGAKTRLVATARGAQRVLDPIHKDDVGRDTLDGWLVGFRPQHDQIVTTDQEGGLQIYSTRDGQKWRSIPGPDDDTLRVAIGQNKLWHVAFSSDGTKIAISSERRVWSLDEQWRLATPRSIIEEPVGSPWISALALDDDEIITGYQDGMWKILDARTAAPLRVNPRAHTAAIDHLQVRGDTLLSAGWDPTLRLWALSSGEPRGVFKKLSEISIAPSWQQLATVDGTTLVSLWDNVPDRLLGQRPATHPLDHVVFIDDDHVVVSGDTGLLELIDLAEPSRTPDELRSLIEARPRWQLVGGRAVERR
jgi:WD40 repeat protein